MSGKFPVLKMFWVVTVLNLQTSGTVRMVKDRWRILFMNSTPDKSNYVSICVEIPSGSSPANVLFPKVVLDEMVKVQFQQHPTTCRTAEFTINLVLDNPHCVR